ncbi:rhomboid family intramembrane serine protease [Stagnihabitans tardus]|uniref:Rhomboid family intramembrane serine protease n=1 Tax=Stagnihabitans tardus TaxID=2699202 RepID=A0AAE5BWT9_9RHOB|nr:rhomboid family intramembrane serine protease [Stagnihabitans tardus]NBZ89662.1 rhomboid family intramembrane serine protease [Stagnihabitans tardus]
MRKLSPAIWALVLSCLVPELVLSGADWGLWGTTRWRDFAYGHGGFWPGLLAGWQPNYPGQAWAMFLTYGVLHGGPVHFAVNMVSLVSLGEGVEERLGPWGFLRLYALSVLGGGLGYGALVTGTVPMVGASGALFGLAGALIFWGWSDRKAMSEPLWPVLRALLWLIGLNVVLYLVTGGRLAWETHLGGFLAGVLVAWWEERREAPPP